MTGNYSNSDTDVVSYRNRSKESVYSDGQELKFHQYKKTNKKKTKHWPLIFTD